MQSRNEPCACGSGQKYKKCCLAQDEAARKPHTGQPALIVCMPVRDQICYETHLALTQNLQGVKHCVLTVGRTQVVEARNMLARRAIEVADANPFNFAPSEVFVLWADADAWWVPETVSVMLDAMRQMRHFDVLFGYFGGRAPYSNPFAYRTKTADSFPRQGFDCAFGDVVEVKRAGFHFALMRLNVLQRVGSDPFTIPTGAPASDTEDFAFCDRVAAAGIRMAVGTGFKVFHIDPRDGSAYTPGEPALQMKENSIVRKSLEHATPQGNKKTTEVRAYGLPEFERNILGSGAFEV